MQQFNQLVHKVYYNNTRDEKFHSDAIYQYLKILHGYI